MKKTLHNVYVKDGIYGWEASIKLTHQDGTTEFIPVRPVGGKAIPVSEQGYYTVKADTIWYDGREDIPKPVYRLRDNIEFIRDGGGTQDPHGLIE